MVGSVVRVLVAGPATLLFVAAAGCADDPSARWAEVGECAAPAVSTPIAVSPVLVAWQDCNPLVHAPASRVVTSIEEWNDWFRCPTAVPSGIDLAHQRTVLITTGCAAPLPRFAVETPDQLVIGILAPFADNCIPATLAVPLPSSAKPVRVATCQETCEGRCPP